MKYMNLFISIFCINQLLFGLSDSDRAPRLDAPPVTSPISVVVPALDLGAVLQVLASINCKIGNVNQDVCENTILSVLGDACSILGISISEAIALLLECCETDSFDFNGVFTVLQDIQNTLTECCSTMTQDFQFTWTILADLNDTITDCCSTMTTDFQFTWTILADLNDTITDCCSTMTTDFQFTWTILADLKDTLTDCCDELRANFCYPIFIRQSDFDPAGQTPYIINSPGVYKLAEDITYNPAGIVTSEITINSSDVILDLQCFTLSQGVANLGTIGISASAGVTDFEIKGGRIENFNLLGKAININVGCSRFKIEDITAINVDNLITLASASLGTINNMTITASPTAITLIALNNSNEIQFNNISMKQNGSSAVAMVGLNISSCTRCAFENMEINSNTPTSSFIIFSMSSDSFCEFRNINIVSNVTAGTLTGFNLTNSDGNEFYNCTVANNQATGASGLMQAFVIGIGSDDNLLVECEAYNNSTLGNNGVGLVVGFSVGSNTRNTLRNCIARNNTAPNAIIALPSFGANGFLIDTATNALLQQCLAEDQDTGVASNAVGFYLSNGSNNTVQDCQSFRQDFGYRLNPALSVAHVFVRNIAGKNTTNYSQFPVGSNQNAADISAINGSLTVPWTNAGIN